LLWSAAGDDRVDDLGRHSHRPAAFQREILHMHLSVIQDFLAGRNASYRKNIKTIFSGME
jgi:hypothetical protein